MYVDDLSIFYCSSNVIDIEKKLEPVADQIIVVAAVCGL